jgi:hypothetical protein
MAEYDLLEYKEISAKWGIFRLNIYQKHIGQLWPIAQEIGDVLTGLHLDIEGQTEDIDAPIVKTSLTFSLIDAPERNTQKVRCGNWEHYYTPDATYLKVELTGKKDGSSEFRKLWSGYVTPDSYTETLQYHGIVTVTARDNIGHLQDFDFDAKGNGDGMITPYELINQAWEKIESPMTLDWRGAASSNEWPQADGVDIIDTYINVSMFKGRTWYDAVSETLYSLGLVMRYIGNNTVAISTLRRMPCQGEEAIEDLAHITPTFMAYATRELVPAVKEINEEDTYDLLDGEDQPQVTEEDFDGTTTSCTINVKNVFGEVSQKEIAVWPIKNEGTIGWGNIKSNTLFFDITQYVLTPGAEPHKDGMFLATNSEPRMVWYGRNIRCCDLLMQIEFGTMIAISQFNAIIKVSNIIPAYSIKSLNCALKLTHNGVEYYYSGYTWGEDYKELNLVPNGDVVELPVSFGSKTGEAVLQLFIFSIDVDWQLGNSAYNGAYLGIKALNFAKSEAVSMLEKNAVNTKYDENNNIKLSRTPSLAPAFDEVAIPGMIKNGIFRKESEAYVPAPEWKWQYGPEVEWMQLPVIIHKQLLCYHSKPNNMISGTIVNGDMLKARAIWTWKDREHLLLSGSYNFLTGHIDGAVLREFIRYEDLFTE